MVIFETFEGDSNYIEISYSNLLMITTLEERKNIDIAQEAYKISWDLNDYARKNNLGYISAVAIRKDSTLGQFLLNHPNRDKYMNRDSLITYNDIVNALNIAMFEDNEIVSKILPLFKNREHDFIDELAKTYSQDVLDYIVNNKDFGDYLSKIDDPEERKISMYGYVDGKIVQVGNYHVTNDNQEESTNIKKKVKVDN